jgi:hypothetical protein
MLEQNEDGTIDYSKFVKIAAKQVLKIHAMDLVTIHLQVKMHQKGQEEVSCPNYPHMKRCAWYAILADPNHNRIMDFKRCVPDGVYTKSAKILLLEGAQCSCGCVLQNRQHRRGQAGSPATDVDAGQARQVRTRGAETNSAYSRVLRLDRLCPSTGLELIFLDGPYVDVGVHQDRLVRWA